MVVKILCVALGFVLGCIVTDIYYDIKRRSER
jgi:hypothetical protein